MATLTILGVRHHSPACARLAQQLIKEHRPRFVLIEGPCDINDRLPELMLEHRLPIAVYSYRLRSDNSAAHGTWSPFCDYSPEWVALKEGLAAGAQTLFIDLPAWDDVFASTENRYSDVHLQTSQALRRVACEMGFDSTDALWDHLFEQQGSPFALQNKLADYFKLLRGEGAADPQDSAREAFMAQWIAWAMVQCSAQERVFVVCGGYHQPALEQLWTLAPQSRPELTLPNERVGSYLVPFSFQRLDSFAGYAAGMPSPAYYQAVWEQAHSAAEVMLWRAANRLRAKGQRASTADILAANQLAHGLSRLRGHTSPLRCDVLDGLAGALLKDATDQPLPWSTRGVLFRGTDPLLVEIVAEFSGELRGKLAQSTPRPPLVDDVYQTLQREGLPFREQPAKVSLQFYADSDKPKRHILHRLSVLNVVGVTLHKQADLRRGVSSVTEEWTLQNLLETEPCLIERAVYGATLEQAARTCILGAAIEAQDTAGLAAALERASKCGYPDLFAQIAERAGEAIEHEPSFAALGTALKAFVTAVREHATGDPAPLIALALARALWLLEALSGRQQAFSEPDVATIAAIRMLLREPDMLDAAQRQVVLDVCSRRVQDPDAPPAIRGACLGLLFGSNAHPPDIALAVSGAPASALGDYLSGLFCLAREEIVSQDLLRAIDYRLSDFAEDEFLRVLPSLRQAFSFFPPRERYTIAQVVARLLGSNDPVGLLEATVDAATLQAAHHLENELFEVLERYQLIAVTDAG